jgi:hypothetical protein
MTRKTNHNGDSLWGMALILLGLLLFNWAIRNPKIALTLVEQPQLILPYSNFK